MTDMYLLIILLHEVPFNSPFHLKCFPNVWFYLISVNKQSCIDIWSLLLNSILITLC